MIVVVSIIYIERGRKGCTYFMDEMFPFCIVPHQVSAVNVPSKPSARHA